MFNHDLLRDLRKLIQYEERKKEVEIKLDQFQMKSPVSLFLTPFNTSNYLFYPRGLCLRTSCVLIRYYPSVPGHFHISGIEYKTKAESSTQREEDGRR